MYGEIDGDDLAAYRKRNMDNGNLR